MAAAKSILSLIIIHLITFSLVTASSEVAKEEFNEELLLKPLPDRKVLAHFHFDSTGNRSTSNGGYHLHLFPKAIYQLVHKFHIREMELSFTQGRWNYERWGGFDPISSSNAKPPGVELWAVFDAPPPKVDSLWKNLTHTLSGLFCASINFLESSTSYSAPEWGFRASSGSLRYGTLPREAVCTENLTPWLKLLPCRDKAGLAELMDRPSIYNGFYHSQRLHLVSSGSVYDGVSEIQLEQTLTVVLQPVSPRGAKSFTAISSVQPSWSLNSIFGRKVNKKCVLAKFSNVYLQLDRGLVSELKKIKKMGSNLDDAVFEGTMGSPVFELSATPDKVIKEKHNIENEETSLLYLFFIEKQPDAKPFDLALTWKLPVVWSCAPAPLLASRFLVGSGNERGAIVISLKSVNHTQSLVGVGSSGDRCTLHINIFQVVPWYVKVYYHTLQIFIDGEIVTNITTKMHVSPSEDKVSPGMLELALKFPCSMKTATLYLDFDKGFLHINEYPPDANQGFDIPSAVVSFPDFHSSLNFVENSDPSPLMSRLQEGSPAMAYTEVLLVPLTTPDFSMPYNVITITCTIFALYFGSLLNALRRRAGEEERLLKDRANRKAGKLHQILQKLLARLRGKPADQHQQQSSSPSSVNMKLMFKIILVALIAVAWHFYFR